MTLLLILIAVFLLVIISSLLVMASVFGRGRAGEARPPNPEAIPFRLKYILLPIIVVLLSVILISIYYQGLPAVADGNPANGSTASSLLETLYIRPRGTLVMWTLLPQFLLALLSAGIVWFTGRIVAMARSEGETSEQFDTVLMVMGNMIAIPQLALAFAMLNTLNYNANGVQLVPLWLVGLIVAVIGALALGIFFLRSIRGLRKNMQ